jgi:hypothetical protein
MVASKKPTKKPVVVRSTATRRTKPVAPKKKPLRKEPVKKRPVAQPAAKKWPQLYAIGSVIILMASSLLWSLLGARVQQHNADQLVDPALFQYKSTLHLALFPSTHSFLFKWPLFFLIQLLGYGTASYIGVTVLVSLITVGALAYLLYKIEPRPVVFGTLVLALASVLLLVPAVPSAGALLPINMAMLTTRNLEYILYLGSLVLLIRSRSLRSWYFLGGLLSLTLLIASDKLFLTVSLGGAVLAIVTYLLARRRQLAKLAGYWLVMSLLATLLASLLLWALQHSGVTHFSQYNDKSPYSLVLHFRHIVLGSFSAILVSLTNFGANPASDVGLRVFPQQFISRLLHPWGISYLINLVTMIVGTLLTLNLLLGTVLQKSKEAADWPVQLSVLMVFSSVAALAAFVSTDHYFIADGRYLAIIVFAVFIGLATALRQRHFTNRQLVTVGAVLVVGMLLGLMALQRTQRSTQAALLQASQRNLLVVQALRNHPVDTLLGDYWRVMPVKQASPNQQHVTPLQDCAQPQGILSSQDWQPNLHNQSFAYLLSFGTTITHFPSCTLDQIVKAYGRPNSSTLIAGKLNAPQEILLFFDHGINSSAPRAVSNTPATSTVIPINLLQLPYRVCSGSTIVNVVAHQDDDLLFMSPTLLHEVASTDCVRTIYLTAGDAGNNGLYWTGRERAVETAYSKMLNSNAIWVQRIVQITPSQFAIVANPRGNPRITLIFMRLPDGNLRGQALTVPITKV